MTTTEDRRRESNGNGNSSDEEGNGGPTLKSRLSGALHGTKGTVKKGIGSYIPGEKGAKLHHQGHLEKIEGHVERKTGRRPSLEEREVESLEHHVGSDPLSNS
eukprot:TRINITY_DN2923_c0_g1_i1.p1 TRINITY_DN2923_c0_g1~~TRINITY_DN2923_c0_g1_i1.p1  ORF type:complete len:114 (-),score=46.62 TRINITY_DN2923_c0_g1_i1:90-398(-)